MTSWENKLLMNNREEKLLLKARDNTITGYNYFGTGSTWDTITNDYTIKTDYSSYYSQNFSIVPEITKIIVNDPATIIFFGDGTKTVVKCMEGEEFSPYAAVAYAIAKKVYGSNSHFKSFVDKSIDIKNLRDDCKYAKEQI